MQHGLIFAAVFVGFFVLRLVAATVFFLFLLDDQGRCPNCDAETLRVESRLMERAAPFLRASWCPVCGWEGTLRRRRPAPDDPYPRTGATSSWTHPGQPPGSSKKSSK
jgi:hypothetical protein